MLNIEKYKDEINQTWIDEPYELHEAISLVMSMHNPHMMDMEILDWLCSEYKEPILTEEEREYLKAVCKPFHEKVVFIQKKLSSIYSKNFLVIKCDNEPPMIFPNFDELSMYTGMELEEEYSLEELGITYD